VKVCPWRGSVGIKIDLFATLGFKFRLVQTMLEILVFCVVGIFAGFLAGFLGIGGGVVVIPCLLAYFTAFKAMPDPMRIAVATTLSSLFASALASSITHYKKGGFVPGAFYSLLPGGIIGAFLGVLLTVSVPEFYVKLLFAAFEIFVGIHFWLTHKVVPKVLKTPSPYVLALLAFGISIISAMLGIGGGVFAVPLLALLGVEMRKAVGTSAILTFIILSSGALGFFLLGFLNPGEIPRLWGDIYYPAILPIMLGAVIFAPIGAHLAHRTSSSFAKRIFGSFLIVAGFYLGYATLLRLL